MEAEIDELGVPDANATGGPIAAVGFENVALGGGVNLRRTNHGQGVSFRRNGVRGADFESEGVSPGIERQRDGGSAGERAGGSAVDGGGHGRTGDSDGGGKNDASDVCGLTGGVGESDRVESRRDRASV